MALCALIEDRTKEDALPLGVDGLERLYYALVFPLLR